MLLCVRYYGKCCGNKGFGDKNKKDIFFVIVEFRVGRVCCFFLLILELVFFIKEIWFVLVI